MPRTTSDVVKALLGRNYDTVNSPALDEFLATANVLVDEVVACAAEKGITLGTSLLERIEAYLTAHFYVFSDQMYASKNTQSAGASFQGQTGLGLEYSPYGQTALRMDRSGCLNDFNVGPKVLQMTWLGTEIE